MRRWSPVARVIVVFRPGPVRRASEVDGGEGDGAFSEDNSVEAGVVVLVGTKIEFGVSGPKRSSSSPCWSSAVCESGVGLVSSIDVTRSLALSFISERSVSEIDVRDSG